MADNGLYRPPPRKPFTGAKGQSGPLGNGWLSTEELLTASGLLSPKGLASALQGPAALASLIPQALANIAERSALNRKTYTGTTKYDAYGNFVFGAAGTALGLSPETLRRGSGAAQIVGDAKKAWKREGKFRINLANGVPWGEYPYGNQANDQPNIDLGIRYAKGRGY